MGFCGVVDINEVDSSARTRVMACQWLLLIALAKSASRTRRSNEFQHEFTPRDSRRGFREYILDLGEAGPFNNASRSRLPSGATTVGQMDQHYQMRAHKAASAYASGHTDGRSGIGRPDHGDAS